MKKIIMILAVAGVCRGAAETLALYTFEHGTAGETAAPAALVNKGTESYTTYAGKWGPGGLEPVFSDEAPGRYVYASAAGTQLVGSGVKSLYFDADASTSSGRGG